QPAARSPAARSSCSVAVATEVLPLVPVTAVTRGRPTGDVTGCIEDPLERRRRAPSARLSHPITGSRSAGRSRRNPANQRGSEPPRLEVAGRWGDRHWTRRMLRTVTLGTGPRRP